MDEKDGVGQDIRYGRKDLIAAGLGDGNLALMSVEKGNYYDLNGTAAAIWKLLEHPCSAEEISRQLASEYEITPAECLKSVRRIFGEWAAEGIIVPNEPR